MLNIHATDSLPFAERNHLEMCVDGPITDQAVRDYKAGSYTGCNRPLSDYEIEKLCRVLKDEEKRALEWKNRCLTIAIKSKTTAHPRENQSWLQFFTAHRDWLAVWDHASSVEAEVLRRKSAQ